MTSIAVFTYNRPYHLKQTIEALQANEQASAFPLYIFIDGPKTEADILLINEIKDYCEHISTFKAHHVVCHEENSGLARSIISGLNHVFQQDTRVIVIEDDVIFHPQSLNYFQYALDKYQDEKKVMSISANSQTPKKYKVDKNYKYDAFFTRRMMCWGWATWRDRWLLCNWEKDQVEKMLANEEQIRNYIKLVGNDSLKRLKLWVEDKIDVWVCRWVFEHFKHDAYCLVPVNTLTLNIGMDGSGTHCASNIENEFEFKQITFERLPEIYEYSEKTDLNFIQSFQNPYRIYLKNIKNFLRNHGNRLIKAWDEIIFKVPDNVEMNCFGTEYGGWKIPANGVDMSANILSDGAGEDISFDTELAMRYGCKIHIFDPTPRARTHFENTRKLINKNCKAPINNSSVEYYDIDEETINLLSFHEVGVWKEDKVMRFFSPSNKNHVSHSINNMHSTNEYFEAQCLELDSICNLLSFDTINLLKLDVEGAEYEILKNMISKNIKPELLLVEFHQGKSIIEKYLKIKIAGYINLLRRNGYRLISRDKSNFVFQLTN